MREEGGRVAREQGRGGREGGWLESRGEEGGEEGGRDGGREVREEGGRVAREQEVRSEGGEVGGR